MITGCNAQGGELGVSILLGNLQRAEYPTAIFAINDMTALGALRKLLRSGLKVQDVAVRLNTNSNYVSRCISSISNQSFSQFVNTFRVRHAQELLIQQPNMKTATIATESGFSNEASFFRNFKAVTNMTPREWLATIN
jgi:YesN/AraC family two-component response regulator